ncbi:MAG: flagellar basal body-associated protein FliL [Herbaspirillum sp.]|nr:flagellar basal body-associated protein FliL [Herbaspirillum sp.]
MATSSKPAKPAAKPAETVAVAPQSKKTLFIVIAVAVLLLVLLIGGATAAFLLISKSKSAKATEDHPEVVESSTPVFVSIEPYVVNLQQETGDQYLQVSITLQVRNEASAEALKLYMPMVRSRLLSALSSKKASELLTVEGKKNLTAEIIKQLNEPFTPNGKPQQVTDVLYTSFVIQQQ